MNRDTAMFNEGVHGLADVKSTSEKDLVDL